MRKILALILSGNVLVACASAPDKISANYVSPIQYDNFDCAQIREEMVRVAAHVQQVAGVQGRAHTRDEVAMGVGLVIFWPALFLLAEGDKKEELANLKGQYDALNEEAISKRCTAAGAQPVSTAVIAPPANQGGQTVVVSKSAAVAPTPVAARVASLPVPGEIMSQPPSRPPCKSRGLSSPTDPSSLKPAGSAC